MDSFIYSSKTIQHASMYQNAFQRFTFVKNISRRASNPTQTLRRRRRGQMLHNIFDSSQAPPAFFWLRHWVHTLVIGTCSI